MKRKNNRVFFTKTKLLKYIKLAHKYNDLAWFNDFRVKWWMKHYNIK